MTDYNDGNWHGWNGGECPVHPLSEVEIITETPGKNDGAAEHFTWNGPDHLGQPIIAFRVTKPHREPSVVTIGECGSTFLDGEYIGLAECTSKPRKFVEVFEDGE